MVDLLKVCSDYYLRAPHCPESESYERFVSDTHDQWRGLPVLVDFADINPYGTASELFTACERGRFEVYRHGAEFAAIHPLSFGDRNLQFRAVHDWCGHYGGHTGPRYDFSCEGELRAWLRHEELYSLKAQKALFCETVLQLAVFATTGKFVDVQKCVIAPSSLIAEVRDYGKTQL